MGRSPRVLPNLSRPTRASPPNNLPPAWCTQRPLTCWDLCPVSHLSDFFFTFSVLLREAAIGRLFASTKTCLNLPTSFFSWLIEQLLTHRSTGIVDCPFCQQRTQTRVDEHDSSMTM
jgi:hypothetical protein